MPKKQIRKRIFEILEVAGEGDQASKLYDLCMMCLIIASLVPLAFKGTNRIFSTINAVATVCFILDYVIRLMTADIKLKRGAFSFILYPFTPFGDSPGVHLAFPWSAAGKAVSPVPHIPSIQVAQNASVCQERANNSCSHKVAESPSFGRLLIGCWVRTYFRADNLQC